MSKLDSNDGSCIRTMRKIGKTWREIEKAYGNQFTLAQLITACHKPTPPEKD